MSGLVIDASVTIDWLLDDERTPAAVEIRGRVIVEGAVVPPIWRTEVGNALLAASRRGRLTREEGLEALEDLALLPIEPDPEGWDRAWADVYGLAADHRLTVYDASYLEVALRRRLPLATFDGELREAAGRRGVSLLG